MSGTAAQGRLRAVDAFRGMTVAGMILVNNPGSWSHVWAPLRHAEWHGWTPTDLVFPFFLFTVGVAVALALGRRVDRGDPRSAVVGRALRRTVVLFALGLLLAGFPFVTVGDGLALRPELATIRIPGVLQRIAVCYLAATLLYLFTRPRTQVAVCVGCLLGYWALMTLVPAPGSVEPTIDEPERTLAAWVDRALLGDHLWRQSKTWDPEGVLSTIPAIATTLLGVFVGRLLRRGLPPVERVARLFVLGSSLVLAGYVWSWWFPINKPIWTSSYAVFTAGLAACAVALCTWVIDVAGRKRWARFFEIYGVNAILVFVASGLLARSLSLLRVPWGESERSLRAWLYETLFSSWLPAHEASFAFALSWVLGWFVVLWALWRKGIVFKV